MSVVVKGMKMPSNCAHCICANDDTRYCAAAHEYIPMLGKPDFCPLVALPDKHGRLVEFVDVDEYHDEDTGTMEVCVGDVFKAYLDMKNAPTIVEAEDGT